MTPAQCNIVGEMEIGQILAFEATLPETCSVEPINDSILVKCELGRSHGLTHGQCVAAVKYEGGETEQPPREIWAQWRDGEVPRLWIADLCEQGDGHCYLFTDHEGDCLT